MPRQTKHLLGLVAAAALAAGACSSASATARPSTSGSPAGSAATADCQTAPAIGAYAMATCVVHAPSLAANLIGDDPTFNAYVLTPAGYETSGKRYPVVYVLAGYTDPATGLAFGIGAAPEPSDPSAVLPIWVIVSGVNSFGGGFYVNSPVTGNWEDAIVRDLVGYMDANYRTLPQRQSRGIAGHSMGGFGAVNLAMRHADVFGTLYALSPGLADATGVAERCADPDTIASVLNVQNVVAGQSGEDLAGALQVEAHHDGNVEFELAYGMAFAGNPASPLLMDFPFSSKGGQIVRDDALWAKWENGFGGLTGKVQQYGSALKSLNGIVVDYGTNDEYAWIPRGSHYFVGLLEGAGIGVEERTYEGDHGSQVPGRLISQVLPYMQQKLATS